MNYKKIEKYPAGYGAELTSILCFKSTADDPIEKYIIDSVFSMAVNFQEQASQKGKPAHGFSVIQFNFINEEETNRAWQLFAGRSTGDPMKKWDEYQRVKGHNRIYEFRPRLAMTLYDVIPRLKEATEKQWRPHR